MPYLTANGIRMRYVRNGKGADAVVLIHGYTASLDMWTPQVPALGENFEVVAYDVRGHGDTDHCYNGHTLNTLVDDLAALLDALGIKRAHLVGLSMGGIIAQRFTLDHPGRVATLTIAASFPGRPDPGILDAFFTHLNIITQQGLPGLFHYLLQHPAVPLGPGFTVPLDLMRTYQEHFLKNDPMTMTYFVQMLNALPDWTQELAQISCPTLLIVGDLDQPCLPAMKTINAAIPSSILHVIPGCGHAVNLEKPQDFNRILNRFLRENPA